MNPNKKDKKVDISGASQSVDLDYEDMQKDQNKGITADGVPDGWDFIIRPMDEKLETIEKPKFEVKEDYEQDIQDFVSINNPK